MRVIVRIMLVVAVSGRSVEGLESCASDIADVGGECVVLPADLGDPAGARSTLIADTEAASDVVSLRDPRRR